MTATETPMLKDNVKHVYEEITGKIEHDRLGARARPAGMAGRGRGRWDRGSRAGSRGAVGAREKNCRGLHRHPGSHGCRLF